jgi:hypothetical protein
VLVGWTVQDVQGEVWVAKIPSRGNKDFYIAFGTCNVEDDIVVPSVDVRGLEWQEGPYFRSGFQGNSWKTSWQHVVVTITLERFTELWKSLKVSSVAQLLKDQPQIEVFKDWKVECKKGKITDFELLEDSMIKVCITFV